MQLSQYGNSAQASGMQHTEAFSMQMNAKMFSILTDKLYSNKEGAVIRELSANARDAHVAAGKADVPFTIKLPTWLDSSFHIRDYGTGIDPQEFYKIYTNLGYSTKENENTSIGAYGLGSKTPFAVTDSYTIQNFWKGTKYVYTAYKDQGMPTVSLVGSEHTDEPDGLQITVTSGGSPSAYKRECRDQLEFFDVKPIILGEDDWVWKSDTDLTKGYHISINGRSRTITVVMGGISYSSDVYSVDNMEIYDFVGYNQLIITAELGDIDIPPSRESLELTEKTEGFLAKRIKEIRAEYSKDIIDNISKAKNIKELHTLLGSAREKLLQKGADYTFLSQTYDWKGLRILVDKPVEALNRRLLQTHNSRKLSGAVYTSIGDLCNSKRTLYVNDLKLGIGPVIDKQFMSLDRRAEILSPKSKSKGEFKDKVKEVITELDKIGVDYELLSSIITLPTVVKGANGKRNVSLPDQILSYDKDRGKFYTNELTDLPKNGFYVPITGFQTSVSNKMIAFATSQGKTVYGLRSKAMKSISESTLKPLESIEKELRKEAEKVLNDNDQNQGIIHEISAHISCHLTARIKYRCTSSRNIPSEVSVLTSELKKLEDKTDHTQIRTTLMFYGKPRSKVKQLKVPKNIQDAIKSISKYSKILDSLSYHDTETYEQLFKLVKEAK